MRLFVSLLAFTVVSSSLVACGSERSVEPPVGQRLEPIAGGQADPDHTSVLGMFTMHQYGGGMCSATLIAPNLVLTARHCIAPILGESEYVICGQSAFGLPYDGNNVFVTNDLEMSQSSQNWWQGQEVRVPSEGNDTCGFDVALVILEKPVPESVTKPLVPRIDIEPEPNELYQAVGYGSTGYTYGGSRMVRGNLHVQCGPGSCGGYGIESTEWLGETGICQGDSGGPALDMNDKVIGVVSRGSQGCDTPIYGSVTAWRDWIIEVALEAAQKGGYDPPFWALTGKSDPEQQPPIEPGTGGSAGAAGSGGAGNVPPEPQGTACSEGASCPNGFACVYDTTPDDAYCSATCSGANPCGAGLTCDEALGVCRAGLGADGSADSSGGCSVAAGSERGPAKPVPWAVGFAAALLALRRRRR